ncbi:MAG: hypothetical protein ACE5F1_05285 [Planctomycetota bacterium]
MKSRHQAFLVSLFDRLPRLEFARIETRRIGTSAFELKALVANEGWLAPRTAMAEKLSRPRAPIVEVLMRQSGKLMLLGEASGDRRLLFGKDRALLKNLRGKGSHQELRWVLSTAPGSVVILRVSQEGVEYDQEEIVIR